MLRKVSRVSILAVIPFVYSHAVNAELTISLGENYTNSVWLDNYDLIENQGDFFNYDLVANWPYASFINYGYVLNDLGSIQFNDNGSLMNFGNFDNSGNLVLDWYSSFQNFNNFNNNGELLFGMYTSVLNTGILNNYYVVNGDPTTEFVNTGEMNNYHLFMQSIRNSGVVNNEGEIHAGYVINEVGSVFNNNLGTGIISWPGINIMEGQLDNHGVFNNFANIHLEPKANASSVTGMDPSVINNSGFFDNSGEITNFIGGGLILNNSGEFNQNGIFSVYGDLIINNTGTFNNQSELNSGVASDQVNNHGIFNNNNLIILNGPDSELNNTGDFYNNFGLEATSVVNAGYFENTGITTILGSLDRKSVV